MSPTGFDQTVELADGTSINGYAFSTGDQENVWIYPEKDVSLLQAVEIFSNSAKTQKIISHLTRTQDYVYEGFTRLTLVRNEGNKLEIQMKREQN